MDFPPPGRNDTDGASIDVEEAVCAAASISKSHTWSTKIPINNHYHCSKPSLEFQTTRAKLSGAKF